MPIIKDGAATMEQGLDLARRGDYPRALEKFSDAARKFSKEGNLLYASVAGAYTNLLSNAVRNSDPQSLMALSSQLRAMPGSIHLKLGPRGINADELAVEAELAARETALVAAVQSGAGSGEPIAQALQALASDYRQLGNRVLYLPELLHHQAVSADSRFPVLMALSFETLGTSMEAADPMTAAEHLQTAQQYWAQAGLSDRAQAAATRSGHLALKAKCWVCGREGSGHGVQFVSIPVDRSALGLKDSEASPLPSMDPSGGYVYICKGCSSAFSGLADRIAVQRAAEVQDRLLREIRAMEQRLRSAAQS